mmetsp:Transcript_20736/g.37217  ORF Transcript_20736/g.37217 Transcript_20736/m.37217 type:complete len:199 (+) Transcript_20736:88-684(+)|eukprot:CAMPEP_0201598778 /NCGR_PEP_ID=MMETSP0492-20130828/479_1 /ASSEMBLY_ACC=CAM_ASM_000837 /TAXON_ID=420259 /ORGANISM="Thalassiosira gravida, Strain GMp14c1" /LENGTH=198 /DNA_ID=CAMNT_0048061251 /DNA_START=114 /DNA_END=710 /DNA_ORIENTATION=-
MTSDGVRIQAATDDRVRDIVDINNNFLSSKHALCCIPLSCQTVKDQEAVFKSCPDKMNVGGLAVDGKSGAALGYCQLSFKGMPTELHTTQEDECYIEWLAVLPEARGKGVGTKLLKWAEEMAIGRKATHMTLGVIRGNPAIHLYEREGFATDKEGCCENVMGLCIVTFLLGRPYGCCAPDWGAIMMRKELPESDGLQP